MIRIFIIDDHPWIIDGLKYKFRSSRDEIEIIGNAFKVSEVLANVKNEDFDLFILDLWLSESDPIDNVKKLQGKFLHKPIIIFTYEKSPFWKKQMFDLGVRAYLNKDIEKRELKSAINQVTRGEVVFSDISFLKDEFSDKSHVVRPDIILTPSEREIFKLLSRGVSQKTIADLQHRSQSAIEKVIRKVKRQYNLNSTTEIIHMLTVRKEI